jgi:ArsR family transcriptional regulator
MAAQQCRHVAVTYIHYSRYMDANDTIDALAALAQPTRLEAFRRLAVAEPQGIAVGELARRLDIPQNTMSTHLAVLVRAGLTALRKVLLFLLQDCCDGQPEICAPLIAAPCCVPQE